MIFEYPRQTGDVNTSVVCQGYYAARKDDLNIRFPAGQCIFLLQAETTLFHAGESAEIKTGGKRRRQFPEWRRRQR